MVSSDATSVSLSWQPPHRAYGIIRGYSIGYYKSANDDDMTVIDINQPQYRRYSVTDLQSYITYQLKVITALISR